MLAIQSTDRGVLQKMYMRLLSKMCGQVVYVYFQQTNAENKLNLLIDMLPPSWRKRQVKSNVTNLNIGLNLLSMFCHMPHNI